MIVISLTDCPMKLRGYLTKYLCEISTGVYVGKTSAKVRDALWDRVCDTCTHGRAVMVINTDNEQGYDFRVWHSSWEPIDLDGFKLMLHPIVRDADSEIKPSSGVSIKNEYVVFDLETTGINTKTDRIIEIGALLVQNGVVVDTYETLVKQDIRIPENIAKLTGITDEILQSGVSFAEAAADLLKFVGGRLAIGYNNREFDEKILLTECRRHGCIYPLRRSRDVLHVVRRQCAELGTLKLQEIASKLGIEVSVKHRALADCYTCNAVYCKLAGDEIGHSYSKDFSI